MELATEAMSSLLSMLGKLLKEEYKMQTGVRKQVESLSRELEIMQAALRKVGEVPRDQLDEQVKLRARDVRELSYDMEDIIDTFLVHGREATNQHGLKGLLKKMGKLLGKLKARHQIANAIKEIKNRIQDVTSWHDKYRLDHSVAKPAATSTPIDPRVLAMYKDAAQLVGVDGPRDALIKMLSEGGDDASKNKMKIVAVVGMGGLGKTTLAKAVYDKLKVDFGCGAFVPVGQNPDMKKVFRDILIGLDKKMYTNLNMTMLDEKQLIDELREFLENKRYFIVIDDIWDKKSWETIKCALADSCCGSRIVATTRIFDVVKYVGDVYELQPLSRDNSEKLFNTRLVDCEGKCLHNQSKEVYDKILKKCGGVPLAIITIASLLASKRAEDWSEVYDSTGFGHADLAENTRKILSFSYYHLPSHLKACLLYLSLFPEDYEINKNSLIWKWIAEGFIHEEQGIGLLEVGETYFNELVNRSMIQLVKGREFGRVVGCRVHDMVLDLVRSLSEEENFVTILDNRQPTFPRSSNRRLAALQKRHEGQNALADMSVQHVRSFIAVLCFAIKFPSFQVLRVLAMDSCDFTHDTSLEHLGNLPHLRFLGLTNTCLVGKKLPEEIGRLKSLQTLDLEGTSIEELPSSVCLLTQLMCLRADELTVSPDWIGNLTALQELWIYPSEDRYARFLKELSSLRELRVLVTKIDLSPFDECVERALVESLDNLHKIQHVDIGGTPWKTGATWEAGLVSYRRLRYLSLSCLWFSRLPARINSSLLPNLSTLEVHVQDVQEQDMETLGRLPELRDLRLWSRDTKVVNIIGGDGWHLFHKLRSLKTDLAFHFTIMPSLESLKFRVRIQFLKDANLGFDKFGLENLPSLHKVTVRIDCWHARPAEVEEAEAALPVVHPTLQTKRIYEYYMLPSDKEEKDSKVVEWEVNVRKEKDEKHFFSFSGLSYYACVETFSVSINCEDAMLEEVEKAEAALKFATGAHPNHPTLKITRRNQDKMILSDQDQQKKKDSKVLECDVNVRREKDKDHFFNFCWLSYYPYVETFGVSMDCEDARLEEVEEAEAALRFATEVHPNQPTLEMLRYNQDKMILSDQHQQKKDSKVLECDVNVREEKDKYHFFNFCWLSYYPCVETFNVSIDCEDAMLEEVEEAEAALKFATDVHPNHPTLEMLRYNIDKMMLFDQHQQPGNEGPSNVARS